MSVGFKIIDKMALDYITGKVRRALPGWTVTVSAAKDPIESLTNVDILITKPAADCPVLTLVYPDKLVADDRLSKARVIKAKLATEDITISNPFRSVDDFIKDLKGMDAFAPPSPMRTMNRAEWLDAYGDVPGCPLCGHPMRLITSKGDNKFWGCTQWKGTGCKGSMDSLDGGRFPVKCLDCGKPMRLREGRKGLFWSCSGYPECERTLDGSDTEAGTIDDWLPPAVRVTKKPAHAKTEVALEDATRSDLAVMAERRGLLASAARSTLTKPELLSLILADTADEMAEKVTKTTTLDDLRNRWRKGES